MEILDQAAEVVAPRLLGCLLERQLDGQRLLVRIVETEAYDQTDVASHAYRGQKARNQVMFGPSGRLYVYFIYGLHYCCNVVTGPVGSGAAVLIRAVEPVAGSQAMGQRRAGISGVNVTNGPAKLCQALAIDHELNGHDLRQAPLRLKLQPGLEASRVGQSTRIGLTKGGETTWRFFDRRSAYVSRTM